MRISEVIKKLQEEQRKYGFCFDRPARHKHDNCPNCRYLGQYADYDLYYCESFFTKTVIARYSSEPLKYLSGWGSSMVPLMVAEALAYRKNLVSKDKIG